MNIFYLDPDPITCARYHGDKHVVKMCTEYSQILSTAHHFFDSPIKEQLCKPSHSNHPSNVWVREGKKNYQWLYQLLSALVREYTYRYGKNFLYERNGRLSLLSNVPPQIPDGSTPLRLAVPDHYRDLEPLKAYRTFYANEKYSKGILVYSGRDLPEFLQPFGFKAQTYFKR